MSCVHLEEKDKKAIKLVSFRHPTLDQGATHDIILFLFMLTLNLVRTLSILCSRAAYTFTEPEASEISAPSIFGILYCHHKALKHFSQNASLPPI